MFANIPALSSTRMRGELRYAVTPDRKIRIVYRATLALQARLRQELSEWIAPCDAVVTVPATGEAPFGIDYTGDAAFCMPWTFMGVPAITIPSGWSSNGLPLGL
jgi:Asp-tRNA(Asn)/Glu-tRNA(Gln) amidotransferase A subunit family amidase